MSSQILQAGVRRGRDWESQFNEWAKPPGRVEQQRCENAENAVRRAIRASEKLKNRNIKIFTHGSYQHNVNVRQDSDVDVGVLCYDTFYPSYPEGIEAKRYGHSDATYQYVTFKNEVEEALVAHFGRPAVQRGNKAFDVHETKQSVEADVAAFFEHRRYTSLTHYHSGVVLYPDQGLRIINWPDQHQENGVRKNDETGRGYKGTVRILKSLRNELKDNGSATADAVSGFWLECLCFNVPNEILRGNTWDQTVQATLRYLLTNTQDESRCSEWGEVSELKYLFRGSPASKRQKLHAFVSEAWTYVGAR